MSCHDFFLLISDDMVKNLPRGMTSYEYACYKPYADQECKDIFRKYLEISETAEVTWRKISYVQNMERDGQIETDNQVCRIKFSEFSDNLYGILHDGVTV